MKTKEAWQSRRLMCPGFKKKGKGGLHGSDCDQQARQVISLYDSSQLRVSCGCQPLPTRYTPLAVYTVAI